MKRSVLPFAIVFLLSLQLLAGETKQDKGWDILNERAKQSLNALGPTPYALEATFTFARSDAPPVPGTYKLIWIGPERWRRDIDVGNLQEVAIGGKSKLWIQRSIDLQPLLEARLNEAIGYLQDLAVDPNAKIMKVSGKKQNGVALQCVETQTAQTVPPDRTLCFNETTGALSLVQNGFWSYEYLQSQLFGQKPVPELIRVSHDGKLRVEIHLTKIGQPPPTSEDHFARPAHAEEWVTCDKPVKETYASKVPPHYPEKERQAHHEGTVVMYAIVAADGSLEKLKVIESSGALFDQASMEAVKQWKYHPPT